MERSTEGERSRQAHEASMLRLFPPRPVPGAITRERLVQRILDDKASTSVVVIQGPAGHGKSTLMQQVKSDCERRGIQTGWLTLHDADNDLIRLVRILQTLLDQLSAEQSTVRPSELETAQAVWGHRELRARAHRTDWVVNCLVALGRPVVLFVDEFQNLYSNEALSFFQDLLLALPKYIRVVISSRSIPEVGLSRLMVMGQADVIRATDLIFTRHEVEIFFSSQGLQLSRSELDAIYERTEGWPAAVQLYRLSLAHADLRESLGDINAFQPRQLTEYLTDNVLSLHPHDVQTFFLETSLLVRMSGPLCDVITGRSDSRELLVKLEDSGLFVRSLDSSLQWFQYHSLFAGFLKAQLHRMSPDREQQIHAQAARWFSDHDYLEEALGHALATRDYAFAAICMERWSTQLVLEGNLATVEKWFDQLPLEEVQRHPRLLIKVAWALAFLRRPRKLENVLKLLDAHRDVSESGGADAQNVVRSMVCILKDDIPGAKHFSDRLDARRHGADVFSIFEAGSTAILKGHFALLSGDLEVARDYLVLGRSYGKQINSAFTVLGSIATAAVNLIVQGRLAEALEMLGQAPADACLPLDQSVSSAAYAAAYIGALYESNQLDAARRLFDQSYDAIASAAQVDFFSIACISMARIYDASDRPGRANTLLEEVESVAYAGSLPRMLRLIAWERVRRAILSGELDRARSIASRIVEDERAMPEGWIPFSEDAEGASINRIRLAVHDGQAAQALLQLRQELEQALRQGRVRRRIKLLLLEAIAHQLEGAEDAAQQSLREAVRLARPGGYIRAFLDEGSVATDLVQEALRRPRQDGAAAEAAEASFMRTVLGAAGIDAELVQASGGARHALSSREEEILSLLEKGMFNREIGEQLFISENTVKFHLKHIYAKLGVKSRSQAIGALKTLRQP